MQFVPRCYKQDMSRFVLFVRQLPIGNNVSIEAEDSIDTRRQTTTGEATAN
jgi:hypothetical protein